LAEANYLIYKQELDRAGEILEKVVADPSLELGVQYDIELVRSALENERAGCRRPAP
jgi:hypothetical protein